MTVENSLWKRSLAGFMILAGTLLLIGSLLYWRFSDAVIKPGAAALPKTLAGLPLSSNAYGLEAVTQITSLHGKEFPITSGAMGLYGNDGQVTLWLSGFSDGTIAAQMVRAMQQKIALGNSPFTLTGEQQAGDRTVYQLDGMGQKHAYFQSGNLVVWLAADPSIAEQALNEVLTSYP